MVLQGSPGRWRLTLCQRRCRLHCQRSGAGSMVGVEDVVPQSLKYCGPVFPLKLHSLTYLKYTSTRINFLGLCPTWGSDLGFGLSAWRLEAEVGETCLGYLIRYVYLHVYRYIHTYVYVCILYRHVIHMYICRERERIAGGTMFVINH